MTSPVNIWSMRKQFVVSWSLGGLGILLVVIGFWYVTEQRKQETYRAYGIENFNVAHMELWQTCQEIDAALSKAIAKAAEYDEFDRDRRQRGRLLILPEDCNRLSDLAKLNYRTRILHEGK